MTNRKTADAAVAQVNYARMGSLVHNNGRPLTEESRPYLEALDREIQKWHQNVLQEIFRLDRAAVKTRVAIFLLAFALLPGLARAQGIVPVGRMNTPQEALEILRHSTADSNMTGRPMVTVVPTRPQAPVIIRVPTPPSPTKPSEQLRPLNCCTVYEFPLAVPRYDIRIIK